MIDFKIRCSKCGEWCRSAGYLLYHDCIDPPYEGEDDYDPEGGQDMICDKCGTAYYGHWAMPEFKCPRCKENTMKCPRCKSEHILPRTSVTKAHAFICRDCGELFGPCETSTTTTILHCPACNKTNISPGNTTLDNMHYCRDCEWKWRPGEVKEKGAGSQEFAPVDLINHPPHYTSHLSGVECITIVEHLNFNIGNAIKYLWRAGLKSPDTTSDLKKAAWYINREIERLSHVDTQATPR